MQRSFNLLKFGFLTSFFIGCGDGVVNLIESDSNSPQYDTPAVVAKFGGSGNSEIKGIATDLVGNSYIVGVYTNNSANVNSFVDFSGTAMPGVTATTSIDGFVVKLNAQGTQQWIKTFGGVGEDQAYNICFGSSKIYVTGHFTNNAANVNSVKDFAGANLTGVTATTSEDVFVAQLDPETGDQQWIKKMGGTGDDEFGLSCAVDKDSDLIFAGYIKNNIANANSVVDFAGNPLAGVSNTANLDSFVAKLNSSGTQQWVEVMGGTQNDRLYYIAVDSQKNIFVPGYFYNSSGDATAAKDFAGNALLGLHTSSTIDGFIAKLDTSGTQQWIRTIGGSTGDDFLVGAAVDSSGNVYLAGSIGNDSSNTSAVKDFTGAALQGATSTVSREVILAKLNSSGTQQWIKVAGGTGVDRAQALAITSDGTVYLNGYYNNNSANANSFVDFSGNTMNGKSSGAVSTDSFLYQVNSSGTLLAVKTLGGTGSDVSTMIAVDINNNPMVCGYFNNNSANANSVTGFGGSTMLGGGASNTVNGFFERVKF